jgi:hypothetical protein
LEIKGHFEEPLLVVFAISSYSSASFSNTLKPHVEGKVFRGMFNMGKIFLLQLVQGHKFEGFGGMRTLKSRIEQGGQVCPFKTNCNCSASGMPAVEPLLPDNCDELLLWMEGLRSPLGLLYQISSSLGTMVNDVQDNPG